MSEIVIEPEADEPIEPTQLPEVDPSEADPIIDEPVGSEEEGA